MADILCNHVAPWLSLLAVDSGRLNDGRGTRHPTSEMQNDSRVALESLSRLSETAGFGEGIKSVNPNRVRIQREGSSELRKGNTSSVKRAWTFCGSR